MPELPTAFLERMRAQLGGDFSAFCAALQEGERASGLRVNTLKLSPAQLRDLTGWSLDAVPWAEGGFYIDPAVRPGATGLHAAGAFYLQEPSAMAVAQLLGPRPGERVLDLAAAPGGKTTQLATLMEGQGLLVANEVNSARVKKLLSNVERWGVPVVVMNAEVAQLAPAWPQSFDRVLLDAPCSGEGMFRKDEETARVWRPQLPGRMAGVQRDLLSHAASLVRPGGVLVYSTCTFSREENEGVVEDFLRRHPDWQPEPVGGPGFEEVENGAARLWPHRLRGEGHFIARLRKAGREEAQWDEAELPPPSPEARRLWDAFVAEHLESAPPGQLTERSGHLYAVPRDLPDLAGLRCPAPGLYLGEVQRGRFTPARALAQWKGARGQATFDLATADPRWSPLDRGEALSFEGEEGWRLLTVAGLGLTWAQAKKGALRPTRARL